MPTGTVTVVVNNGDAALVTVSPPSLEFTTVNWAVAADGDGQRGLGRERFGWDDAGHACGRAGRTTGRTG